MIYGIGRKVSIFKINQMKLEILNYLKKKKSNNRTFYTYFSMYNLGMSEPT